MATVNPVTTFDDNPSSWLDYLASVLRWTIGSRCTAAQLVVVGAFDQPNGVIRTIELIKGRLDTATSAVELDSPDGAGAWSPNPVAQDGDELLAFLGPADGDRRRPVDAPGALVTASAGPDFVEQQDAARWFCALDDDPTVRAGELADAAASASPSVRSSALRAIADEGLDSAVPAVIALATDDGTEPVLATYAAVSLWLLGRQDLAREALESIVGRIGSEAFLALWGVQRSVGDQAATLYGPDPDAQAAR